MSFSTQNTGSSNYENINNVFDKFARNQQFSKLNGQTNNKGYLNQQATTGSLNYQQTNSNNQSTNSGYSHQLMGLPTTTMQSRTNCSSPASNSSITTSKSSPTAGNLASQN